MKGRQKEGVFGPDKLQNHTNEGKRKEKKMSEEEGKRKGEKSKGCTLSFYNGYFGDVLLLDGKGPFSGKVFKNLARYINIYFFSSPENFQSLDCEHALQCLFCSKICQSAPDMNVPPAKPRAASWAAV